MTPAAADTTILAVLAPFAAAALAPILTKALKHNAAWILALVPAFIFFHFTGFLSQVAHGDTARVAWAWSPAYAVDLSFFVDGLSLVFALLISGIGTFIILYSGGYLKGHPQQGRFFSFIFLFMGAMLGLVLSDNLITLFVFWELTSITSFLLIGFNHLNAASRRAALQALIVTGGGGLSLMAGVLLIIGVTGHMSLTELLNDPESIRASGAYLPVFLLVLGGAFTKSAQFPFHFWLPNAMEAPTPVSAFLHSATMVKAGVYLLMRLHPVLGDTALWSTVLPIFGGITLLVGTLLSLRQTDLKLILAYTTVASLGLLVMLTGTSSEKALEGAVLYLVAHSLFKGALFMVAGTVDHETGTRDITRLGGLKGAMPVTFAAGSLAALSMCGLPPFIGFIAKEVLYEGTLAWGTGVVLTVVAVIGNGLMFAAAAAVAIKPFWGAKTETPKHAHEGPVLLFAGPVALSLAGLAAALFAHFTGEYVIGPMLSAVEGHAAHAELHLIPAHIGGPLYLSVATVVFGVIVFLSLDKLRGVLGSILTAIGWGPDKGFDQALVALVNVSTGFTRAVQRGRMQTYMTVIFVITALAFLVPLVLAGGLPKVPEFPQYRFFEWGVFVIAVLGLGAVLMAANRLTAIVSLGIQGFAVALIFMLFGAPDLSFTQFMVETLSVVILALVMTRLDLAPADHRPLRPAIITGIIALSVGTGIMLTLMSITQQPFDTRLSDFFSEYSRVIAHGRNIVNVIIVDFRAFDTLGEIAVVVLTGLCVLALIRVRTRTTSEQDEGAGEEALAKRQDMRAADQRPVTVRPQEVK